MSGLCPWITLLKSVKYIYSFLYIIFQPYRRIVIKKEMSCISSSLASILWSEEGGKVNNMFYVLRSINIHFAQFLLIFCLFLTEFRPLSVFYAISVILSATQLFLLLFLTLERKKEDNWKILCYH